jgi:peptidoglycan/LPS O-acetylase OafA/YrhL
VDRRAAGWPTAGSLNSVTGVRLLLASAVLLSHSWPVTQGDNANEPVFALTHGQLTVAHLAVNAFFILSGYLVAESWFRSRSAGQYLAKRALRIYPGWLACVLVMFLVIVPLFGGVSLGAIPFLPAIAGALVLLPPELQGVFPSAPRSGTLNASLWTIQYEFACYIALAMLLTVARRRPGIGLLVAAVAGVLAQLIITLGHGWFPPAEFAACFFGGSVFYRYRDRIPQHGVVAVASIALLAASSLLPGRWMLALAPVFMVYPLLLLASLKFGSGLRVDYSYGVYLYAFPIQQVVATLVPNLQPLLLAAVAFPITLLIAALSWHVVEEPCLRLKRGLRQPPRMVQRAAA